MRRQPDGDDSNLVYLLGRDARAGRPTAGRACRGASQRLRAAGCELGDVRAWRAGTPIHEPPCYEPQRIAEAGVWPARMRREHETRARVCRCDDAADAL